MNEYELLYVIHARKAVDDVQAVIDWVNGLIEQGGGASLSTDNWGRRRLAYPIEHEFEGTYVLATFELPPQSTGVLEAQLVISEDIIRHILIRGIIPYESAPEQHEPEERREREPAAPASEGASEPATAAPTAEAEPPAAEAETPVAEAETPAAEAEAPVAEAPTAEADTVEDSASAEPASTEPAGAESDAADAETAEADEAEGETDERAEAAAPSPATAGAE